MKSKDPYFSTNTGGFTSSPFDEEEVMDIEAFLQSDEKLLKDSDFFT